ncbi:acetolactate synthase large subunit [Litorilinea aerophila]|uniref:Acetolactate synthase large subunit n=1 Tax=Litorilinea aerophila TaxID=1204385 RepID=A0A540VCA7_9CHLR|nr:acetolactate synthase large subunit [Litorilinea aerophila]MCC9077782.1 acetolactate synthase large subunit [Litorilinea aerophila]OUC08795.1 decarboxylase [Litorilinea aerophila]
MNGAQSLIQTLVDGGVEVCFTNPGTSEMHFVAALDTVPGMRAVLGLFEGVCTGAADGYARMAGKPAVTLLHLGPGLGNGLANLHNARRAHSPVVNIVGEHATYHIQHDAPLTSDIQAIAGAVSGWVHTCRDADSVAADAAAALAAALQPPGQVATLILPADCAWSPVGRATPPPPVPRPAPRPVDPATVDQVARILRSGQRTALLLTGPAVTDPGLELAARIGQATGARVIGNRANARLQRGAGRPVLPRLPYPPPQARAMLADLQHLILVGAQPPVAFFAYPDQPSLLAPPECTLHTLATLEEDILAALDALAEAVAAPAYTGPRYPAERPPLPTGELTLEKVWRSVAALMPEEAIVSDESITSGRNAEAWTLGAPPHDWLSVMGGAIGQGLPVATGAAVACPDRRVLAMEADGSAMYTLQALWTQAREGLDVVTVLFNNGAYAILQGELRRVGAEAGGPKAGALLDLTAPAIDWVALARGMGVPASRPTSAEEFNRVLSAALAEPGPHLIEVQVKGPGSGSG